MGGQISGLLTLIAAILGLAGLVGGFAAFSKTKLQAATIAILETSNSARDDRIALLESENLRIASDLQTKQDAIHILTNMVTGREQLDEILEAIRIHENKLVGRDVKLFGDLKHIVDTLTELKGKVSLRDVDPRG